MMLIWLLTPLEKIFEIGETQEIEKKEWKKLLTCTEWVTEPIETISSTVKKDSFVCSDPGLVMVTQS